jgi:hypothetical protein
MLLIELDGILPLNDVSNLSVKNCGKGLSQELGQVLVLVLFIRPLKRQTQCGHCSGKAVTPQQESVAIRNRN